MRRLAAAIAALVIGLALAACDGATSTAHRMISSGRLTVVVSLPFTGPSRPLSVAVLRGARMALADAGGHVGRYAIRLRALDDATASSHGWDPGQTTINARAAAKDTRVIGFLGDLNSGATAVSIPVLNRADVPQVSPLSTAVGLTRGGPEASPGEPQKYYPTQQRTFARVIPSDVVQSAVQVALQREAGCRRGYVVYDDQVDGRDAATSFQIAARRAGLRVLGYDQYDPTARSYASLASKLVKLDPDCVLISALPQDNAAAVTTAIARALPSAQLYATSPLAQAAFVDPARGGVPESIDDRLTLTSAMLAADDYPPAGRRFLARYARRYGPGHPEAIFGYEAMAAMLDAIGRASDGGTRDVTRTRVLRGLFGIRDRRSVLGTYSIDPDGDVSLHRFGVYHVQDGRMMFWKALRG